MRTYSEKISCKKMEYSSEGIIFYSREHQGYAAVGKINKNGNAVAEWINVEEYKKEKRIEKLFIFLKCFLLFNIPSFLVILIWFNCINALNPEIADAFTQILLIPLLIFWLPISKSIVERKARGFHGALNMIKNAYAKLRRVPNLEEIEYYSRFENYSVDNLELKLVWLYLAGVWCNLIFGNISLIAVVIIVVAVEILDYKGFMNFMQFFTTKYPTQEELEAAIKGLNLFFEKDNKDA